MKRLPSILFARSRSCARLNVFYFINSLSNHIVIGRFRASLTFPNLYLHDGHFAYLPIVDPSLTLPGLQSQYDLFFCSRARRKASRVATITNSLGNNSAEVNLDSLCVRHFRSPRLAAPKRPCSALFIAQAHSSLLCLGTRAWRSATSAAFPTVFYQHTSSRFLGAIYSALCSSPMTHELKYI